MHTDANLLNFKYNGDIDQKAIYMIKWVFFEKTFICINALIRINDKVNLYMK